MRTRRRALFDLCNAHCLRLSTPSRARSAPCARAAYRHMLDTVSAKGRKTADVSDPGTFLRSVHVSRALRASALKSRGERGAPSQHAAELLRAVVCEELHTKEQVN